MIYVSSVNLYKHERKVISIDTIVIVSSWVGLVGFVVSIYLVYITKNTKRFLNDENLKESIKFDRPDLVYSLQVIIAAIQGNDYEDTDIFSDLIQLIKYIENYKPILSWKQKYYMRKLIRICTKPVSNQKEIEITLSSLCGTLAQIENVKKERVEGNG